MHDGYDQITWWKILSLSSPSDHMNEKAQVGY